jgi:site-specific DNA recombinase
MIGIGYGRASTSKQVEFGTSIVEQERYCRRMAEEDGCSEFVWLCDSGISGKDSDKRPEFQALLSYIKKGNCKIYAYSMSRLARNLRTMIDLWDLCEKKLVDIRTFSDQINTSGPMGRFIRVVFAAVWQLQREMIGEDTKDKLRSRKERGIVYSPARYGYDVIGREVNADGKVINPGNEVKNEFEYQVIESMVNLRKVGLSDSKIARVLNRQEIPTKKGGLWRHSTIKKILENHK